MLRLSGVHVIVVGTDTPDILLIGPMFDFVLRGYLLDYIGSKKRVVLLKEE